jgi:hypothetical protein
LAGLPAGKPKIDAAVAPVWLAPLLAAFFTTFFFMSPIYFLRVLNHFLGSSELDFDPKKNSG